MVFFFTKYNGTPRHPPKGELLVDPIHAHSKRHSTQLTETDRQILDVLRTVNHEGSYQGETKRVPTTSKNSDSQLNAHSTVEDWRNLGEKMKLNEP